MKEEGNILKKVGAGNPFSVPDGYFENLTSEVMNRLPEKETPAFVNKKAGKWDKMKPWVYMAAMFMGAALIIKVASTGSATLPADQVAAEESDIETEYISSVVDNTMLDDYSLYVYLTDADAE